MSEVDIHSMSSSVNSLTDTAAHPADQARKGVKEICSTAIAQILLVCRSVQVGR